MFYKLDLIATRPSHQVQTLGACVYFHVSPCAIVVDEMTVGQIFLEVLWFSLIDIIISLLFILGVVIGPFSDHSCTGA